MCETMFFKTSGNKDSDTWGLRSRCAAGWHLPQPSLLPWGSPGVAPGDGLPEEAFLEGITWLQSLSGNWNVWIVTLNNFANKSWVGGVALSDYRIYYKVMVMRSVTPWHQDRQIDHWIRIEDPEIDQIYMTTDFWWWFKGNQWREENLFDK